MVLTQLHVLSLYNVPNMRPLLKFHQLSIMVLPQYDYAKLIHSNCVQMQEADMSSRRHPAVISVPSAVFISVSSAVFISVPSAVVISSAAAGVVKQLSPKKVSTTVFIFSINEISDFMLNYIKSQAIQGLQTLTALSKSCKI